MASSEDFKKLYELNRTGDRSLSRIIIHEFTSWHEYFGGADFFPLCNVNAVLGRISMDELTALVDTPLDNDVCCIDNPCSPAKKTRRCQTVAKADRNRQIQNIKCIKKIIIADRTVSCYRVLGSEHIFPRVFFRYTDMVYSHRRCLYN